MLEQNNEILPKLSVQEAQTLLDAVRDLSPRGLALFITYARVPFDVGLSVAEAKLKSGLAQEAFDDAREELQRAHLIQPEASHMEEKYMLNARHWLSKPVQTLITEGRLSGFRKY